MNGSFDILRQSGWDLWVWLCMAASVVLVCYAIAGRVWERRGGLPTLILAAVGAIGTISVAITPALHRPFVGLGWTLALMCILSAAFYLSLRDQLGIGRMSALLGTRCVALTMLVPMLFEPVWRYSDRPTPRRAIYLLVDTSGSMSVPDVANGPSRVQSVWQTLSPLLPKLGEHFIPHVYCFSTKCVALKKPDDLATIVADGKSTDLATAVSTAANAAATDPDARIVLFSDGNDNVSPNVTDLIRQTQRKIDTVCVGSETASPSNLVNVAVDSVQTPPDVAVGHEVKLTALIKSTALANRIVDVNLAEVDDAGKPTASVTSQRLILQPTPQGQTVALPYTAHAAGVRHLAVWIDPVPGERILSDNRQDIQILAIEARIKVLYVEGAARPEYTYLIRMLNHDADVELATLLRIQQDRFAASGAIDGNTFTAIPATPDQWKDFDVILIGDLDSSFLSPAQQSLIRQRVSDGGGLLMIGGEKNFGAGGYKDSPLEEALPVFVGGLDAGQDKEEFVPQMTPEGAAHPALEELGDWLPLLGKKAAQALAPLKGNVVVAGPKSGAQVLLVHPGSLGPDGKPQIVLAVQQYGNGRSAAFTADTTNVWFRQFRDQGQESAYNRFWGQLIRWLAGQDVRKREKGAGIEALLNKSVYPFGESAKLRVIARDEHGDTTQYATVTATLSGGGRDKPEQLPATPSDSQPGEYQVILPPPGEAGLKPGEYALDVSATKDNAPLGKQTLKFSVIPPEDEMLKLAANPKQMEEIATETGGYYRPLAEFPDLLDTLIQTDPAAGQVVQHTVPLSNTLRLVFAWTGHDLPWPPHSDLPAQGALVVVLLAGEWVMRRKWQLP
ncbi:MAG: glutamine amidotransferase [Tepidisphaeraceae bacterium]